MIHTTIGFYPDNSYRINGVKSENLACHIAYNRVARPGRALMVDGFFATDGMMQEDRLDEFRKTRASSTTIDHDTAPYV